MLSFLPHTSNTASLLFLLLLLFNCTQNLPRSAQLFLVKRRDGLLEYRELHHKSEIRNIMATGDHALSIPSASPTPTSTLATPALSSSSTPSASMSGSPEGSSPELHRTVLLSRTTHPGQIVLEQSDWNIRQPYPSPSSEGPDEMKVGGDVLAEAARRAEMDILALDIEEMQF
ncbi:hypothetical protein V1512DRAFT_95654 [Lipomyces arxii]|uniref:uncharacterized protein n=1 Tax=Lipomyces arxii TaxID=56418 RepID=UPI0034CF8B72